MSAFAQEQQPFADWLADLHSEALTVGISETLLDEALSIIEEPIPRVIELDQSQPEFVQTFSNYMSNRLSQARIERGQALLEEHSELFRRIYYEYGVQPALLSLFLGFRKQLW